MSRPERRIPESFPGYGALARRIMGAPPLCGAVRVVCIDGPAGSGKTTAASEVVAALSERGASTAIVHLDDLYEGWEQDLAALAARVDAWILVPLRHGLPAQHPRFDWHLGRFADWRRLPPADVLIIEGAGAASAAIRAWASLVLWIEAEPELRLARGLARDGEHLAAEWAQWQMRERAHFDADGTRAAADVHHRTDVIG